MVVSVGMLEWSGGVLCVCVGVDLLELANYMYTCTRTQILVSCAITINNTYSIC